MDGRESDSLTRRTINSRLVPTSSAKPASTAAGQSGQCLPRFHQSEVDIRRYSKVAQDLSQHPSVLARAAVDGPNLRISPATLKNHRTEFDRLGAGPKYDQRPQGDSRRKRDLTGHFDLNSVTFAKENGAWPWEKNDRELYI